MSACVKTGAVVHMIPHDLVFMADLFEIEGAMVVRANGPIERGGNACSSAEWGIRGWHRPSYELLDDHGRGFWRDDLGVFVVPADCLRKNA